MWDNFKTYFDLGLEHIIKPIAWDHVLYVVVLCIGFLPKQLKTVFWLITAFTVGHSITLLLAALNWLSINTKYIEFAIPITMEITCLFTFSVLPKKEKKSATLLYFLACFFGMIHGLAFASDIFSLEGGKAIWQKILGFNIGIELAQLIIVFCCYLISIIFVRLGKWEKYAKAAVILAALLFSIQLAIKNYPF
jgi:hypothetical protein